MKGRLERIGFKVSLAEPTGTVQRKKVGRRRDLWLLARRKVTPEHLQAKNSLFGGRGKQFRIVDYGGLDE